MLRPELCIISFSFLITNLCTLSAQTWCPPERVSPYVTGLYIIQGQGLTADISGTPWCGWVVHQYAPYQQVIYVSRYGDTAWCDPDTIYPFGGFDNCNLTTDADGNVWVVAKETDISACFYDGSSWSNLMLVPPFCWDCPVATGDNLGNLWVCCASAGPGEGHHIYGNSYISGQWGTPVLISYPGNHDEVPYSMITDKQGRVWVGWSGAFYRSIKLCASFNDGSGWSDTMVIAEYPNHTRGPALTVDISGRIWAGWLNREGGDIWKVYANYYDGGVWQEPMLVSSEPSTSWPGDWPIAITSDDAGMVWLTWMNPDTNLYYSYWNGSKWSIPASIDTHPARDYHPKMTFDGERIWVTWIREMDYTFSMYASYTYGIGVEEMSTTNFLPAVSGLSLSYPNPFSSNISVSYQLQSNCRISLEIYDIAGRLIRTLVNKNQKAGHYVVNWNGKDNQNRQLPGGIYFVRLETPTHTEITKVVLLD